MQAETFYQIRVKGHLPEHWTEWFDGLSLRNEANGEATLAGPVADQAALHALLVKLRDLHLPVLAVNRIEPDLTLEPKR